jgi:transcription factor IIIB subunit 2
MAPRGKSTPAPPPSNPFRDQRPIRAPVPVRRSVPAPRPKRACPNKECNDPKIEDGICESCGTIVDDSNIVSEVQFGETSGGAAVVQGSYVGAESSGARGPAGLKSGGGSDRDPTFDREFPLLNGTHILT